MNRGLFPLLKINPARRRGVSLVETLIALLVLSIGILAVAAVPIMTTKLAVQSNKRELAVFIAVNELDALEADERETLNNSRHEPSGYKGIFVKSSKNNGVGEAVVDWSGASGKSSLTMERQLSRHSDSTRGKGLGE